MANRARQGLITLGYQSILFAAAMRGIFMRPSHVFAPVATGLMAAALCGTAITAELGARKVRGTNNVLR